MKTATASHRVRRLALWASGLLVIAITAAFVFISLQIGAGVRAASKIAVAEYGGDHVDALTRYVEDDRHSFAERNRAVWALGQLGDGRALPTLRKYHSGEPCDHGSALCQRELAKAIKLLDGGWNATALVWRGSEKE